MPASLQAQFNNTATNLNNFQDTVITTINLDGQDQPNVMVIGKLVLVNNDGDAQNANVHLIYKHFELDSANIRIPSGSSQSVSVIGWIRPPELTPNQFVDLRASTFNGVAQNARLIVIGSNIDGG